MLNEFSGGLKGATTKCLDRTALSPARMEPYCCSGYPMTEDELEILEEFIQESREHLTAIEPDLLEMERQGTGTASEIVNRVFRAIHSIKGGAAFLAFESLKGFSHVMENVLMLIRDGKLSIAPEVIDALLRGVDVLRRMVEDVRDSNAVDCTEERLLLEAVVEKRQGEQQAKLDSPAIAVCPAVSVERAPTISQMDAENSGRDAMRLAHRAHGKKIYRIAVRGDVDLPATGMTAESLGAALASIGQIIECSPAPGTSVNAAARVFEWEIATVLERQLLAVATGLPERCFSLLVDDAGHADGKDTSPSKGVRPVEANAVARGLPGVEPNSLYANPPLPVVSVTPKRDAVSLVAPSVPQERTAPASGHREQANEANDTLRVRVELLNRLMDSASELVLGRNQLLRALKEQGDKSPGLGIILQHIDRVTTDLQEGIMQTRMQQIGSLFGRFARVARDLGRQLGKDVELRAEGNHVELDKSIIEALAGPLTHIVRNAVDHAIETPEERRKRRKPEVGRILLSASHESGQVKIVVEDDGRGIDRAKVLRKALEKGLIAPGASEKATDRDIVNLLMMPGFSTADQVSDVSGRGVGMDVVRNNVEALGGQIEIDSEAGMGTSVQLRLPLTLAIIPSLIIGAAGARFAVPQASIVELVWVKSDDTNDRIKLLHGSPMLRLRERLVPLVEVRDVLGVTGSAGPSRSASEMGTTKDQYILLLRTGTDHYGLVVDDLFESEEIVVKPLPLFLKGIECFAGTTILGDGSVTMILDPSGIAIRAGLRFGATNPAEESGEAATRADGSGKRSVILFAGSPAEQYIVPQEQVLRLERVDRASLQRAGGKDYVCYRGVGLPLVRLEQFLPVGGVPDFAEEVFLLIPRMGSGRAAEPTAGILVWRILDAVDIELNLQPALFDGPGVRGSTLLEGVLTTMIDPLALVEFAQSRRERAA